MRLSWRPLADRDREKAIDHIAADNPIKALAQLDRIENQTDMLLQQPKLGRPGRAKGTRELVISGTPFVAASTSMNRSTSRFFGCCTARSNDHDARRQLS